MFVYSVLSFFAYGIYSFVTDTIRISQISSVDKALVELGTGKKISLNFNQKNPFGMQFTFNNSTFLNFSDVIESGIRFYEKLLNKNIAIRELSGKDLYSVKGNEYPGILRYNVFPLTTRKLFLETALQEAKKKEADEANSDKDKKTEAKLDDKKSSK